MRKQVWLAMANRSLLTFDDEIIRALREEPVGYRGKLLGRDVLSS
jgi:hypothetical protein